MCNKDTVENRHIAGIFHYVRRGTIFNHCHWVDAKQELTDIVTKAGSCSKFKPLWELKKMAMDYLK